MSDELPPESLDLSSYDCAAACECETVSRRYDLVRRAELSAIVDAMAGTIRGRRTLEVACGTGYWAGVAARSASSVVSLDMSPRVLAEVGARLLPQTSVPGSGQKTYEAGLASFWLSHVPRASLEVFLRGFHGRLEDGAPVLMVDNMYLPGIAGTLLVRRGTPDTYRLRRLPDGSLATTVKNYFDEGTLRALLEPQAEDLEVRVGTCFWWLQYRVKNLK